MMAKTSDERGSSAVRGPFYRPLRIHDVSDKVGLDRHIEATPQECAAVAAEQGVPAIASLEADLHVMRRANGRFDVTGIVVSTLTQICVVSLEPFESTLRQDVDIKFALPAPRETLERIARSIVSIDMEDEDDPPDPIIDNTIDLGSVAFEFLTLARDLYPKKPGVHFADVLIGDKNEPEPSPFAALERFKDPS